MSSHLRNIEGVEMAGKLPEVRLSNTPLKVVSPYEPAGDQPQAIAGISKGVEEGLRYQTLLGVTGSGKTYTMAKVIEQVQKPTLVLAPNKTLAAQLASELKEFFPDNAVVYFVSYYDYYQPEAYVRLLTPLSRRMRPSTKRWKSCAMRLRPPCFPDAT